jgi:murein DD-endopeptidase MepM/ murein hydrolase activator NlpD
LKRVVPKVSDIGFSSLRLNGTRAEASGGCRRVQTSAAMLGLALSFGASAPLLTEPELALAADGTTVTVLPAADSGTEPQFRTVSDQGQGSSDYHTVEAGESLWHIATEHEADVQALRAANGIATDDVLRVGQVIRVPAVGIDNLAATSSRSRLALEVSPLGGVGGDLSATSVLESSDSVPSVDDLESSLGLESSLDLDDADELTAAQLELNGAAPEGALTKGDSQSETAQIAILPEAVSDDVDQLAGQGAAIWSVSEAEENDDARASIARANVTETTNVSESEVSEAATVPVASLPLHDEPVVEAVQSVDISETDDVVAPSSTEKELVVAALTPVAGDDEVVSEASALRPYQVKPGDTLWSIASRNGVSLDDLISHNDAVDRPEALTVGDSLSIPVTTVATDATVVDESTEIIPSNLAVSPRTREQVIQDHLARIRESNSALVDRQELNARIRAARQVLENSRRESAASTSESTASTTALLERRGSATQSVDAVGGTEPTTTTAALTAREGTAVSSPDWTVSDASQAEIQQVAVADDVIDASTQELSQPDTVSPAGQQLLAAAPLGADAYRMTPNLPVGQSVSPSMPMMPGASEFLPEAPANGYIWPAQGVLTSGYGWRWGRMHRGVDIAAPVGTPIFAAASGVVVRSGWNSGGYGNLVDIRHSDGSMTRYAHNSRLMVRQGEQVRQGQQIAAMGSTGFSTGPHLHFEVHLPSTLVAQ